MIPSTSHNLKREKYHITFSLNTPSQLTSHSPTNKQPKPPKPPKTPLTSPSPSSLCLSLGLHHSPLSSPLLLLLLLPTNGTESIRFLLRFRFVRTASPAVWTRSTTRFNFNGRTVWTLAGVFDVANMTHFDQVSLKG